MQQSLLNFISYNNEKKQTNLDFKHDGKILFASVSSFSPTLYISSSLFLCYETIRLKKLKQTVVGTTKSDEDDDAIWIAAVSSFSSSLLFPHFFLAMKQYD